VNKNNQLMLTAARDLAKTLKPGAVIIYTDSLDELAGVRIISEIAPTILVARTDKEERKAAEYSKRVVRAPNIDLGRLAQINIAALLALSNNLINRGDIVIGLSGEAGSELIDALLVVEIGENFELLPEGAGPIGDEVKPPVFRRVLEVATELAAEGREASPVGALFIVGDIETVLVHSTQFIINPFKGYQESERNILDPQLAETVKEFSLIDGAFLIRGDGIVVSAGTYLHPSEYGEPLPRGLGARHAVAAAITKSTRAIAITVSQSSGSTRIFRSGRILMEIQKPTRRAK